jgi:predicted metal-dependent hydrolase
VQEAVRDAGLELTMSALANTFLDEEEARAFARDLTNYLGIEAIGLRVVPDLEGRIGGVYDPTTRSISIESPARSWTVLHEVAHAVENGHGEAFRDVVIELAGWVGDSLP